MKHGCGYLFTVELIQQQCFMAVWLFVLEQIAATVQVWKLNLFTRVCGTVADIHSCGAYAEFGTCECFCFK